MTLTANAQGKLRVCHQLEDYMFRPIEFETMNFLDYMVETYERRAMGMEDEEDDENDVWSRRRNDSGRYQMSHPKMDSHVRVRRFENHVYLPNIVGPWFPRRDGDENSKPYYFAAMLSVLKPWRTLETLKDHLESWESAFESFMVNANQRDKDVVAGSQYYYESKGVIANRDFDEDRENDNGNEENRQGEHDDDDDCDDPVVSRFFLTEIYHLIDMMSHF